MKMARFLYFLLVEKIIINCHDDEWSEMNIRLKLLGEKFWKRLGVK
jgi:hypothetical protein